MGLVVETLTQLVPFTRALQEGPLPLTAAKVVEWLSGPPTATGQRVSPEGALRLAAVYACVRVISEDVAKLPLFVYRRLLRGKSRAPEHPLYSLLHDSPNPYMTAMQFRETLMGHLLLRGNAYASIDRNRNGAVQALWPLRPDRMEASVVSAAGTLVYKYYLPNGEPRLLPQNEVFHLRGLSSDGLVGYSPITLHRETVGLALASEEYAARFFGNNASPGGVLQAKTRLNKEAAERLARSWSEAHQGLTQAHRVAVLEEGVEWKQVSTSPEDAQYLEHRKYGRSEIASIFRVPPHKIGDLERATFSNIEEQAIEYVSDTLQAWLVRIEQQINMDLLLPGERQLYFAEHLMDALLRGKALERAQALQLQRQNGIINADDWNEIENRNPLPDGLGEDYWMPSNFQIVGEPPPEPAVAPITPSRSVRTIVRDEDGRITGIVDGE